VVGMPLETDRFPIVAHCAKAGFQGGNPMNLKFLAISDTHLGEDCSLFSFPHGRQHLWLELRRAFNC